MMRLNRSVKLRGSRLEEVLGHDPPLNLARGRAGQLVREEDALGDLEWGQVLLAVVHDVLLRGFGSLVQHDARIDLQQ